MCSQDLPMPVPSCSMRLPISSTVSRSPIRACSVRRSVSVSKSAGQVPVRIVPATATAPLGYSQPTQMKAVQVLHGPYQSAYSVAAPTTIYRPRHQRAVPTAKTVVAPPSNYVQIIKPSQSASRSRTDKLFSSVAGSTDCSPSNAGSTTASGLSTPSRLDLSHSHFRTNSGASGLHVRAPSLSLSMASVSSSPSKATGGDQESDWLEKLGKANDCEDKATSHVQLVSLGCYCGPKLTFQKIGRGAETLPFDWLRTSLDGLLQLLRSHFSGFYNYCKKIPPVPGHKMTVYRGHLHSFWHDNPDEESMRERYDRRIERLYGLGKNSSDASTESRPLLFVRTVASTDEARRSQELLETLQEIFGNEVRLLIILPWQKKLHGPVSIENMPNLLVYCAAPDIYDAESQPVKGAPYSEAVKLGLDWAVGRDFERETFSSLEQLQPNIHRSDWGYTGLGGISAFEDIPASGS
eukprot:TRINITY_DN36087_c0_g1_i1.p1 TRINITY_DN36087_c0_g1~~TRINITY_DN36087_c0_g1_i1.p1  ORF type:complete len:465 (-),score=45.82 TRINITY_DN36087_c0_g1_i1:290-1684(-)